MRIAERYLGCQPRLDIWVGKRARCSRTSCLGMVAEINNMLNEWDPREWWLNEYRRRLLTWASGKIVDENMRKRCGCAGGR